MSEKNLEAIDCDTISRVEVIGPEQREYVRYLKENERMTYSIQDEGRTLKIFIGEKRDET